MLCHVSLKLVNLINNKISDDGVCKLVLGSPRLEWIGLGECNNITDRSLEHIAANAKNLKGIDLHVGIAIAQPVSDRLYIGTNGLEQLLGLPRLGRIALSTEMEVLRHTIETQRPDIEMFNQWEFSRQFMELCND